MSPDSRPSRSLPVHANLEQQKKQARELLRAVAVQDPTALRRLRDHHARLAGRPDHDIARASLALHDAQLVVAREYGFTSWAALKHEIERRQAQRQTRVFVTDITYYNDRVAGLVSAHDAGVPQALAQIREWHPAFADASDQEIRRARFDTGVARLGYARQHGFPTFAELTAHVQAVERGERTEPFREAFEAMRGQQWDRLIAVIRQHPDVLHARGTNGNTLLNLAISLAGRTCDPSRLRLGRSWKYSFAPVRTSMRRTTVGGRRCIRPPIRSSGSREATC